MNIEVTTTVAGIPALAVLTHYWPAIQGRLTGHPDHRYPSEPSECEFDLLHRDGTPAPDLDAQLSEADAQRIKAELAMAMRAEREDAA